MSLYDRVSVVKGQIRNTCGSQKTLQLSQD